MAKTTEEILAAVNAKWFKVDSKQFRGMVHERNEYRKALERITNSLKNFGSPIPVFKAKLFAEDIQDVMDRMDKYEVKDLTLRTHWACNTCKDAQPIKHADSPNYCVSPDCTGFYTEESY